MPVELSIVETVTELETTVVEVVLDSSSAPGIPGPGVPAGGTVNQVLTKDSGTDYDTSWQDAQGGGGGAPDDADYLVGTAHGDLSAEIVVGTAPGGELGGTWASPTIDATHSGSSHAAVQAAAEATAASELATHAADTTSVHGIADTSALALTANHPTNATFNDHSARHENGGADEISLAGLDGTPTELTNHLSDATDAHDASAISVLDSGAFYTGTDVEAVLAEIAPQLGGGSGESMQRDVTQTAHGFTVGQVVTFDGTDWTLAQADVPANAEVLGLVAAVVDTNTFTLHYGGRITGLTGLTAGTTYYLSDTVAGGLTSTEPADAGEVSKPLLVADATTSGYFFNWRGSEVIDMATQAELDAHITDSADAHDASAISVADSGGNFTATQVEGVLEELFDSIGGAGTPADGWIDDTANTWTRTADQTFTVSGDRTAVFQKGTRLKWTQTTVKYGVVVDSSHAAGTTTVTIATSTDYVLTAAAISANFYSYAANPQGYPGTFAWTPTWTGFSAAPASVTARFAIVGRICTVHIASSANGTSNATTVTISLPASAALARQYSLSARVTNNGTIAAGPGMVEATGGIMNVFRDGTGLGWTASGGKNVEITGYSYFI